MPGGCPEGQQCLCRQRPILVKNFALRHNKISPRAQHARIRFDTPARHRLKIVDAQLHGSDLRPVWYRCISRDRRRSIRQRRQNSSVHHAVNLLVVRPHVQPENGPARVHAFHVESQKLRRAAFFHPPPHQFRDPFLLFSHFLRHRVSPLSTVPPRPSYLSPPNLFFTALLSSIHFFASDFFGSDFFPILFSSFLFFSLLFSSFLFFSLLFSSFLFSSH